MKLSNGFDTADITDDQARDLPPVEIGQGSYARPYIPGKWTRGDWWALAAFVAGIVLLVWMTR